MEEKVSIKVKIADRVYPLRVTIAEEPYVRKAVKDLDVRIKDKRNRFKIKDIKDILAMIALEYGAENIELATDSKSENDGVSHELDRLEELLDMYIG